MNSDASTIEEYLAAIPADRSEALSKVRAVIIAHLPEGVVETMRWGMISYEIPLETYPNTYNKAPLSFAALANQKNHMSVYLCAQYSDETLRKEFEAMYRESGQKLDAGKACVRFKSLDGINLDAVGAAISRVTVPEFIQLYESTR